jgi:RND family efflux transporter MFP subunit
VLAELEIEDLLNQLNLAKVDLENAQEQYAAAEETQRRKLFSAQMTLDIAQLRLDKAKTQAPIADFTSLRLNVDRAAEALDRAKIAYKEALDRPWEAQRIRDGLLQNITQAERNYSEAEARYQEAVREFEQRQQAYEVDVKLLEMEVQKAAQELAWLQEGLDPALAQTLQTEELKVQRLEDQVATAQLIAPFAGQITSLNVLPGRSVEAYKKVAVIADPSKVDITADLTTNQMSLFEEGQPAEVATSKRPGEIFEAIIQQLPYPYGTGGGQAKVEDADERAHITLVNPDELELQAGDLVKVTVLIERSEDTLFLPPAAVRSFEGRTFVMVKEDDRLRKVDVKIGIEGEDRWEILSGLEEGQTIEGL